MGEPPVRLGAARGWLCHVCGALNPCRVYYLWYYCLYCCLLLDYGPCVRQGYMTVSVSSCCVLGA